MVKATSQPATPPGESAMLAPSRARAAAGSGLRL
jgi:hypothetical protein